MKERKGPPPDFRYREADPETKKKGWQWIMDADYEVSWSRFRVDYRLLPSLRNPLPTKAEIDERPYATVGPEGILVRKEYAWDGSTFGLEWKSSIRGSLIHDVGYQVMRDYELEWDPDFRKKFRWDFDRLLLDTQRQDGMSWLLRRIRYRAVRLWPRNRQVRGSRSTEERVAGMEEPRRDTVG